MQITCLLRNMNEYKQCFFLQTLLFIAAPGIYAQPEYKPLKPPMPEIRFQNVESYLQDSTLHLSFDLSAQGQIISSGETLHIVPVYRAAGNKIAFPGVIINGKKRHKYYLREQAFLSHENYWQQKPYAVQVLGKEGTEKLSYTVAKPIPTALSNTPGTLEIEQYVENCCNVRLITAQPVEVTATAARAEIKPVDESNVSFIRPKGEEKKIRNEQLTVRINYRVNRSDVQPGYDNNASELAKVEKVLRPLSSQGETYKINSVSIKGYASPEASYGHNLELSQRRADGFKQYLMRSYNLYGLQQFPAVGLGEDWDGLRCVITASEIPYRNEILSIIDHTDIFNGREKRLMELAGGYPYRYMLNTLFPPLRRMKMQVDYTVRPFKPAEADEMIDERPQDLSQEEIYEVARMRNRAGRKGYGREYDVAARYFPNDATANINAASAALIRGDLEEAWHYLQKVQGLPEAYNNLGVYYWIQGDAGLAEEYFIQALSVKEDEEKAHCNLQQLIKSKKNASSD